MATAAAHLHPHHGGDRLFGDVAATLVTVAGHRYSGFSIDTAGGTGSGAEHAPVAAIVTPRE